MGNCLRLGAQVDDSTSAGLIRERPFALGAHPMGDAWLVNGSRHGIVELGRSPVPLYQPDGTGWLHRRAEVPNLETSYGSRCQVLGPDAEGYSG